MHLTNHILHQLEIAVIALEAKHQKDYERSLEEQEFSKNYKDKPYLTLHLKSRDAFGQKAYPIDLLKTRNTAEN